MYTRVSVGSKYSRSFKTYIEHNGKIISPFHDIPTYPGVTQNVINVVCEIPRFENAKFEINTGEEMNPITQDIKKGNVRFVANIFPMRGYPWNYGAVPQTWEDPGVKDEHVGECGDNDPIDVIEIGKRTRNIGEVYQVKVLGCIALIDAGECDWKIVAVDINNESADLLNDIGDVEKVYPRLLDFSFEWMRDYKIPTGSLPNEFGLGGEFMPRAFAEKVIKAGHDSWVALMGTDSGKDISKSNALLKSNGHCISSDFVVNGNVESDTPLPETVSEYFFVEKV